MNREAVLMKAVADVIKERTKQERTVKQIDAQLLLPEFTNEIAPPDFGPLTEAIDRFAARELPVPIANVNVEAPHVELHPKYEFSPKVEGANVHVDMEPVAKAICYLTECMEKAINAQTACIEKMVEKMLTMLKKGHEIEIIKDKDGKITGARRK